MIIYKITNKINGKIYIGQTVGSLNKRWNRHCRKNSGCLALINAIEKYGKDGFTIEQIDSSSTLEELNKKENEWVLKCNSLYPNGYNLNTGGNNKRWSNETKLKMSKTHTGKLLSEKHKLSIKRSVIEKLDQNPDLKNKGRDKVSKSLKELYSKSKHPKKDKKVSDEGKERISESKKGIKNHMFGKKLTDSQLEGLKIAHKNRLKNLPSVLCHQNGQIYENVTIAARELRLVRSSVSNVLTGFRKSIRGYTFEYVKKSGSNET